MGVSFKLQDKHSFKFVQWKRCWYLEFAKMRFFQLPHILITCSLTFNTLLKFHVFVSHYKT